MYRRLHCLMLVCAVVIFSGISMISFQYHSRKSLLRCDEPHIPHLSRLAGAMSKELSETDWRELLQMVDLWLIQKGNFSKKPINRGTDIDRGFSKPRTNIFFLKTHKTASSTIINLLFRYGEFHNLTFAFPKNTHQFRYPKYFLAEEVYGFSSSEQQKFNILCQHMRFSLDEVEKVMPSDTFYFTILRNPVTLMESSFAYFKNTSSFSKAKNIEDFLNNSNKFYQRDQLYSGFAKNPMTFDLGFDHNGPVSLKHFKLLWRAVDTIFDLVLIAEYFDESLVLLKDALCWNLDDVLSFPLNTRSDKSRSNVSDEAQERIKSWNQLDWQLYIYFNNSFWNHVERFGRKRMRYKVEELKKRRAQLSEKCLDSQVEPSLLKDKLMLPHQSGLAKILGYNLKSGLEQNDQQLCHRLVLPEVQYNDLLKKKQVGLKSV
ncbi:galactose-3-O-sulfotransferase 4-like [Bufo bufo]|uniref:galactose-3-O-sulfotransferase 4-like n=1 Tax=Bufo bufo TaxID=8384 RepID=UPI001ABEAE0E|nr:galactose-3-O-sulfotransferase 4-like [Bufo bufo]